MIIIIVKPVRGLQACILVLEYPSRPNNWLIISGDLTERNLDHLVNRYYVVTIIGY